SRGSRGHFRGPKGPPLTNYASEIIENRSGKQSSSKTFNVARLSPQVVETAHFLRPKIVSPPFEFRGGKNVAPDRLRGAIRSAEKPPPPLRRPWPLAHDIGERPFDKPRPLAQMRRKR